jgi:hypothetical protein
MPSLENDLGEALLDLYRQWQGIGYQATYFKRMLTPGDPIYKGPVRTVKHLLGQDLAENSGFNRLRKANKIDLTVEALVVEKKWHPFFEEWEVARAAERLRSAK